MAISTSRSLHLTRKRRDFAADLRDENRLPTGETAWELTLASLRATYYNNLATPSPNQELNRRIAASILACFHSELFNSLGTIKSHWMLRMSQVTDDAQGLVEDLLQLEAAANERFTIRR